jgi:hypothetical protein
MPIVLPVAMDSVNGLVRLEQQSPALEFVRHACADFCRYSFSANGAAVWRTQIVVTGAELIQGLVVHECSLALAAGDQAFRLQQFERLARGSRADPELARYVALAWYCEAWLPFLAGYTPGELVQHAQVHGLLGESVRNHCSIAVLIPAASISGSLAASPQKVLTSPQVNRCSQALRLRSFFLASQRYGRSI